MTLAPRPLVDRIRFSPAPYDSAAAARLCDELHLPAGAPGAALVAGVAGCSPFLARQMSRRPRSLRAILEASPEAIMESAIDAALGAAQEPDPAHQMRGLRLAKSEAALAMALGEVSGALDVMRAAELYSDFADAATNAALRMALGELTRKGFCARDEAAPERDSGIAIIGMGKLGGRELNFSSDIDLIVLYDPAHPALGDPASARAIALSAVKILVARLSSQTADGYVFRTDLRLRPDPGASAAAVSVNAAEAYYEGHGQNWERAAFIRARPVAGDIGLGEAFLHRLRPFMWRKYLDYAAIEDIHSIKRQIHAAKGGTRIEFAGHDVKIGRGGIREIEFMVQTQQLILGGKDPFLRVRSTLDALSRLAERNVIGADDAAAIDADYRRLRTLEHRLQMIEDEQTHRIPADIPAQDRLAKFLGHAAREDLERETIRTLTRVHGHFSALFGREEGLSAEAGSLSFTGVEADADTLKTIAALGFSEPRAIADTIRRWHMGDIRATRTVRGRELLTKLTPRILQALSAADRPDDAFRAFDQFLHGLPAGVQIFALFANTPAVFETLIRIMTISPWLGRELSKRSTLVEALIEMRWPRAGRSAHGLQTALAGKLGAGAEFEAAMNIVRRWASEENFNLAAETALGVIDPDAAGAGFTAVAEAAIRALLPVARAETERLHGRIAGEIIVIGLGRLGSARLTAASDLDLMFIYETPDDAMSDGEKSISGVEFFTRLVRRFVTAMSAPTEEGLLYEIDMQLRPSGAKGPTAVRLDALRRYHGGDAWTWEKMALVKARVVAGDAALASRFDRANAEILAAPRDAAATARDVEAMRARLIEARPPRSPWDLKSAVGGITEIDFIVQFLTLIHAPSGAVTAQADPPAAIRALAEAGALGASEAAILLDAFTLYEAVLQVARASTGDVFVPATAGEALRVRMAAACNAPDIQAAEAIIARLEHAVRNVYQTIVIAPYAEEA